MPQCRNRGVAQESSRVENSAVKYVANNVCAFPQRCCPARKQITPHDHPIRVVPKAIFLVLKTPARRARGGAESLPKDGDVKLETLK